MRPVHESDDGRIPTAAVGFIPHSGEPRVEVVAPLSCQRNGEGLEFDSAEKAALESDEERQADSDLEIGEGEGIYSLLERAAQSETDGLQDRFSRMGAALNRLEKRADEIEKELGEVGCAVCIVEGLQTSRPVSQKNPVFGPAPAQGGLVFGLARDPSAIVDPSLFEAPPNQSTANAGHDGSEFMATNARDGEDFESKVAGFAAQDASKREADHSIHGDSQMPISSDAENRNQQLTKVQGTSNSKTDNAAVDLGSNGNRKEACSSGPVISAHASSHSPPRIAKTAPWPEYGGRPALPRLPRVTKSAPPLPAYRRARARARPKQNGAQSCKSRDLPTKARSNTSAPACKTMPKTREPTRSLVSASGAKPAPFPSTTCASNKCCSSLNHKCGSAAETRAPTSQKQLSAQVKLFVT